jgi:hypothetical protein
MRKTMKLQKVLMGPLELMYGRLRLVKPLRNPNKYSESNF